MNSSIQPIGPSQSFKPSFGVFKEPFPIHHIKHPAHGIIEESNWLKFRDSIEPLENILVEILEDGRVRVVKNFPEKIVKKLDENGQPVLDKITRTEIVEKIIPAYTEEHFVDFNHNVSEYINRYYLHFNDGSFQLSNTFGGKDLVKYGYSPKARHYAAIEDAAVQLDKPEAKFDLHSIFGRFSK